jgi:hypothetical protein
MRLNVRYLLSPFAAALLLAAAACSDDSGATDPVVLPAVQGVSATATASTAVRVSWSAVPTATSYDVERAAGSGSFAAAASGVTTTSYDDSGLVAGTEYRYRVRARLGTTVGDFSSEARVSTTAVGPKARTLSGNITANTTLRSDTLYTLSGYVKVTNGATLTIEPGTRIVGDTLVPGSSLWILRGARIQAVGTADRPIVFTSARAAGQRKPGDWGGIVIVGNAPINRTASTIFTEGPSGVSENYAGGTDPNDNSGTLKYVRIEFAGYDVSNGGGQELNSLSLYAVGRGTTIEYVQTLAGLDDSFEFFGGTVDVRYLVSYESGDDHFDWTEGYQGRGQFLIALQTTMLQPRPGTGTVSSDPRGFEGDGCESDKPGCTYANAPNSTPLWANFTLVGPGAGVFATTDGNGAVIRRGSGGTLVNGVIARWPGVGISLRDAETRALLDVDSLMLRGVVLSDNGSNFEPEGRNYGSVLKDRANAFKILEINGVAALLPGLPAAGAAPGASLDFTPAAGSALATAGLSSFAGTPIAGRAANFFGGTLAATAYAGAADPSGPKWWQGWTAYYRN